MRQLIRLGVLTSALGLTLGCGADNQAPPPNAPAAGTQQPTGQQPAGQAAPQGNALTAPPPAGQTGSAPMSTPSSEAGAPATAAGAPAAGNAVGRAATPGSPSTSLMPGTPSAATPAAPAPYLMLMEVPSGTELSLILETPVSSATAKVEQDVRARLANPIVVSGMTVLAEGTPFTGNVVAVQRAGKVKGRSSLAIRFNSVTVANKAYKINTSRIVRVGEATKSEDATKIGIGAGAGAIIGGIAGGKKGAAIGAGVGGGAGTGVVLATRGQDVSIPEGATVRTTVQEAVRVNAPM